MDAHADRMQATAQRKQQARTTLMLKLLAVPLLAIMIVAFGYFDQAKLARAALAQARVAFNDVGTPTGAASSKAATEIEQNASERWSEFFGRFVLDWTKYSEEIVAINALQQLQASNQTLNAFEAGPAANSPASWARVVSGARAFEDSPRPRLRNEASKLLQRYKERFPLSVEQGLELAAKEDAESFTYQERVKDWNRLTAEERRELAMGDREVERCLDAALAGGKPIEMPPNQPTMVIQVAALCRAALRTN